LGIMFMELKVSLARPASRRCLLRRCRIAQWGAAALPREVLYSSCGWTEGALKNLPDPPEAGAD